MNFWQELFLISFIFFNLIIFINTFYEISKKRNIYGLTKYLFFIGAFVWGDVFILAPFWIIAATISIFFKTWNLFLLFVSVFWTIRSFGEIIYWLNEQFATKKRNEPHTLKFHNLIKGEAIWFIYQLFWECIFVFSLILTIYFSYVWIRSLN